MTIQYNSMNKAVYFDNNKNEIGSVKILKQQQEILKQHIENYNITPKEETIVDNEIGNVKRKSLKK